MKKMKTLTVNGVTYQVSDPTGIGFEVQTLTEDQMSQARTNIGAADLAEMVDLRRDYSGNVHETASQAVMTDINDLHDELSELGQAFNASMGNIETALDSILAIQNQLIGGDA